MHKEVEKHIKHMSSTFYRLLTVMFTEEELDQYVKAGGDTMVQALTCRKLWVRTSELVEPGVTTESMALMHLLYFQSIGRVLVEDIDPNSGAILLHLGFADITSRNEERTKRGS